MQIDGVLYRPLGSIVELHTRQVNPGAHPSEEFEHYSIPAYDAGLQPVVERGSEIKSNKFVVPNGAILLSKLNPRINRVWSPRTVGVLPAVASTEFLVLTPAPEVDGRFIHYLLKSPAYRDALTSMVTGTSGSHQRVRPADALSTPVPVPPRTKQAAIGAMLGALDDKIELNRRTSETLGQIGRAAYEGWFLPYANGADLPSGWHRGPLSRFFAVGLGGAWGEAGSSDKATEAVHCLRGIDCHELSETRLPDVPVRWLSRGQLDSRRLSSGTVLVEASGSFCGRSLAWAESYDELFPGPVGYSNFVKRLDPRIDPTQATVAAFGLREAYIRGQVQGFRTGTAFPNLDVYGLMEGVEVVVPTPDEAGRFIGLDPVERRVVNLLESKVLAEIRDALLPKLISGELRVSEAEQLVSEVT